MRRRRRCGEEWSGVVTEHLDINPRYREIHKSAAADEIAASHSEPETSSHSGKLPKKLSLTLDLTLYNYEVGLPTTQALLLFSSLSPSPPSSLTRYIRNISSPSSSLKSIVYIKTLTRFGGNLLYSFP